MPIDPIAEARRQRIAHGWEDAADGMAAVTSIMRAHQIMLARVDEELRDWDLTFVRYELLMLLHFSKRSPLQLVVVGARLEVHPTSLTSALDRLEEQGFVRREPHPTDRRAKLAVLTDEGRAAALAATDRLNEHVFSDPGLARGRWASSSTCQSLRAEAGDF